MEKRIIKTLDIIYWCIILITTIVLLLQNFQIMDLKNNIMIILVEFFISIIKNWFVTLLYIGIRIGVKRHLKQKLDIIDVRKYENYYKELIKQYSPAVLNYVDDFTIDQNTIIATLMSLELKGIIDKELNIINKEISNLDENEKYILSNISNIKNIDINIFNQYIVQDCNKYKLLKNNKITNKQFEDKFKILIPVTLISILGIITSSLLLFLGGIAAYVILFMYLMTSGSLKEADPYVRTKKAQDINEKLEGLKKYLQDYGNIQEKTKNELIIWEEYLIYSVMFNQNTKLIEEYKKIFNRYS